MRHVPLVGDVAAGTGVLAAENIEETVPLPEDFTGDGQLFMLRVRGDSMIDAGILDRDYVVVRQQPDADNGDIVVAGIPGEEATVKTFLRRRGKIVLRPANPTMSEMVFEPGDVTIYGKVVTLLRRLPSSATAPRGGLGRRGRCVGTPGARSPAPLEVQPQGRRGSEATAMRDALDRLVGRLQQLLGMRAPAGAAATGAA